MVNTIVQSSPNGVLTWISLLLMFVLLWSNITNDIPGGMYAKFNVLVCVFLQALAHWHIALTVIVSFVLAQCIPFSTIVSDLASWCSQMVESNLRQSTCISSQGMGHSKETGSTGSAYGLFCCYNNWLFLLLLVNIQ